VYTITLLDCLRAIKKAKDENFFNFDDFDYEEYEHYEKVQNGDFNWLVPQKFLAFCGPHHQSRFKYELTKPLLEKKLTSFHFQISESIMGIRFMPQRLISLTSNFTTFQQSSD
jgi:hypothetical protein